MRTGIVGHYNQSLLGYQCTLPRIGSGGAEGVRLYTSGWRSRLAGHYQCSWTGTAKNGNDLDRPAGLKLRHS